MAETQNRPNVDAAESPDALASGWWTEYRREAMAEDGDPDAYVESLRDLSEAARPQSAAHEGFALFLERLRSEDLDVELDVDDHEV